MSNLYWLSEAQMERLRPYFPKARGRARDTQRREKSMIIKLNNTKLRRYDNKETKYYKKGRLKQKKKK